MRPERRAPRGTLFHAAPGPAPVAHPGTPSRDPPAIVAERLTFQPSSNQGPTPLRDLSFEVAPGQTLLVSGPSGCGKSTLLSLIAGLGRHAPEPRVSGRLTVRFPDDTSPHDAVPAPMPGLVGFLHQEPGDGLLGLDVLSALAMPLEQAGIPRETALARLEHALEALELMPFATREVGTLSAGERKRAALAGIEALDPPLVLMDEPLADLDPNGAARLLQDLGRLGARRTVVLAEHRTEAVRHLADVELHMVLDRGAEARPWHVPPAQRPEDAATVVADGLRIRRGGRILLERARLRLTPGVWALMGPNGAGKSTLLATLAGLVRPEAGTVRVTDHTVWADGVRPKGGRGAERDLRRDIQVAFQDPRDAFFAPSVTEEVQAPLEALGLLHGARARAAVTNALDAFALAHVAERAPTHLSWGEARRVQVIGDLLVAPHVWFLDEPTHGLDPAARRHLARTVAGFAAGGGTVVVATHEPSFMPPRTEWLFLPGDGNLLTGDEARPGATGPADAGYTAPEAWDGDDAGGEVAP